MKTGVILVRTQSGWKSLAAGDDIAALRSRFKEIACARALPVGDEHATEAIYFDTAGLTKRKRLDSPAARAAVSAANGAVESAQQQAELRAAEAAARSSGKAQAVEIAQKAAAVIVSEIRSLGAQETSAPAPAQKTLSTPPALADDEDEARKRFAPKRGAKS